MSEVKSMSAANSGATGPDGPSRPLARLLVAAVVAAATGLLAAALWVVG